jgi:hypothetical protein
LLQGITVFLLLLSTLLLTAGCGNGKEAERTDLPALGAEEIDGELLWRRITEQTDYENYPFWPDHRGMQPGQAPHGPYHRIFINSTLYSALPAPDKTAPNGAIIVKENYTGDKSLNSLTVMAKIKGYAPGAADWFWAKYSPKGDIQAQGTPPPCISCHAGMRDNDYIIVHPLDKPQEK